MLRYCYCSLIVLFVMILQLKHIGHTIDKNLACLNLFTVMSVKNAIPFEIVSFLTIFQHQFQGTIKSYFLTTTVSWK